MKEHPVDTVLHGLGEIEPREGFEREILVALRAHEQRTESPRHSFGLFWIPATAVVVLAITGTVVMSRHHPSAHRVVAHVPVVPKRAAPQTQAAVRAVLLAPPERVPVLQSPQVSVAAESSDQEASFPAPPMPLTEQEKLLLRVIHRDDPVLLASLAYDTRLQLEQDKADVNEFFAPKPSPPMPDLAEPDVPAQELPPPDPSPVTPGENQ